MKEKSPWLAPSCASLKPRLYQIGVTEFSREPEELKKLLDQKKTEKAALYLLLRYRMTGMDIPDLLLWVLANQEVSRQFLGHFLNQYRERIRILVRVIFTLDEKGDIILLYPFVKKHDRNTMHALEASVHIMEKIRANPGSIIEYQFEQEEKGRKNFAKQNGWS